MNGLIFLVEEAPEGGYTARALGESIFTEADDLAQLQERTRDAVRCHFDKGMGPHTVRFLLKGKLTNRKSVEDWIRKGDRVRAIQEYMRQTGAGLKEAYDAVDAMMKEMRKQ